MSTGAQGFEAALARAAPRPVVTQLMGKVVQDCKYEVQDDWCASTQLEWTVVDKAEVRAQTSIRSGRP